jgi:hypothetical protein
MIWVKLTVRKILFKKDVKNLLWENVPIFDPHSSILKDLIFFAENAFSLELTTSDDLSGIVEKSSM